MMGGNRIYNGDTIIADDSTESYDVISSSVSITDTGATKDYKNIYVDTTSGDITLTFDSTSILDSRSYLIKKIIGNNRVVINIDGGDLIDGGSNLFINTIYNAVNIQAVSSLNQWFIS